MALHVVDAGQYVESGSAPNVGPAFSVSAWYRPTTLNAGTVLGIGSSGTSQYVALGMGLTGQGFLEVNGGGTGDAFATGTFSDNAWHHLGGVSASNTSRIFYADGVAGTTDTASISPSGGFRDRVTIGALRSNGSLISTAQGDIAECAIWSVALDAAEITALAAGFSPLLIRPASLVFYAPLIGGGDPERDIRGGLTLPYGAAGAAPTVVPHPRVFKPAATPVVLTPTAVAGTTVNAVAAEATFSAATPVLRVDVASVAAVVTYSAAAPALTAQVASSPAVVTFSAAVPTPTVGVPGAAATVTYSAAAPALTTDVPSVAASVAFSAAAPVPTVAVTAQVAAATFSAVGPALAATVTSSAAVATFTAPVPTLTGGTIIATPWTYGGDDVPAFSYGGDDVPDWTYGGD